MQQTTKQKARKDIIWDKHPALYSMFFAAAQALLDAGVQDRLQQLQQQQQDLPGQQQPTERWQERAQKQQVAQEVSKQLTPQQVLDKLEQQPGQGTGPNQWQQELQAAHITQISARRVQKLFKAWQEMVLVQNILPVRLEPDPSKRRGIPRVEIPQVS